MGNRGQEMLLGLRQIKSKVRPFRQLSSLIERELPLPLNQFRPYLHELQANRSAKQSEISKINVFYRTLSPENLTASKDHLNNALYFSAIFVKKIPESLLQIAHERVEGVEDVVLRALAQKLLAMDQWPIAEKLINKKFSADASTAAIMKFEALALNGNYRKMVEHLPSIAKSSGIPQQVQFRLLCLLNSKDGKIGAFEASDEKSEKWGKLLQIAMKGRILSANAPSLETFIRLTEPLSAHFELKSSLLALGFTRCRSEDAENLSPEVLKLLKSIYRNCSPDSLIDLASRLNSTSKRDIHEDVVITLLERICRNPQIDFRESVLSSLLCWIIRFSPEKYSLPVLMSDFAQIIDSNVARHALEASRLHDENCVNFIEFCLTKKKIQIAKETVKEAVDIASERYGFIPTTEFMRHIHQTGYSLSSKFYLKQLVSEGISNFSNLNHSYDCFKLIYADNLHGELLQQYLQVSQKLMERCIENANLDYCQRIHRATAKYQILKSLEAPKAFKEFIADNFEAGKFSKPFRPTNNVECIRIALNCIQKSSVMMLSESFCLSALGAALINLDFSLAQRLSVYMNTQGYSRGNSSTNQNILLQWARRIQSSV